MPPPSLGRTLLPLSLTHALPPLFLLRLPTPSSTPSDGEANGSVVRCPFDTTILTLNSVPPFRSHSQPSGPNYAHSRR